MRKTISTLLVSAACVLFAQAGFDVPRSVFKMDQLAEAKSEAAEKGKPLVFVYSNSGTT